MPLEKYSCSGSDLMFTKGRAAMDAAGAVAEPESSGVTDRRPTYHAPGISRSYPRGPTGLTASASTPGRT
jgi:hypothetical protein